MTCLVIHGGAGALPRSEMTAGRAAEFHGALRTILAAGQRVLTQGGASLDAVEATVIALEENPLFNAGRGSSFTREGKVEMEAALMDGATRRAGAVTLLRHVRNPVQLARRVMDQTPHVMLGGEAAEKFAVAQGLRLEPEEYFFTPYRWAAMLKLRGTEQTALSEDVVVSAAAHPATMSTVGAVALDTHGNLAAATSSGGTSNKYAGRIGQACLVGAGVYANNATCAVSCTGQGEAFIRGVTAYEVSALMEFRGLALEAAAELAIRSRLPGRGGLIALDRQGRLALPFNTEGMYRGWIDPAGAVHTSNYDEVQIWPETSA